MLLLHVAYSFDLIWQIINNQGVPHGDSFPVVSTASTTTRQRADATRHGSKRQASKCRELHVSRLFPTGSGSVGSLLSSQNSLAGSIPSWFIESPCWITILVRIRNVHETTNFGWDVWLKLVEMESVAWAAEAYWWSLSPHRQTWLTTIYLPWIKHEIQALLMVPVDGMIFTLFFSSHLLDTRIPKQTHNHR